MLRAVEKIFSLVVDTDRAILVSFAKWRQPPLRFRPGPWPLLGLCGVRRLLRGVLRRRLRSGRRLPDPIGRVFIPVADIVHPVLQVSCGGDGVSDVVIEVTDVSEVG
jgi:hypothetical protein